MNIRIFYWVQSRVHLSKGGKQKECSQFDIIVGYMYLYCISVFLSYYLRIYIYRTPDKKKTHVNGKNCEQS